MTTDQSPSCYLMGGDSLLLECAEMLLSRGFDVRGVISRNPRIQEGAHKASIPFFPLNSDFRSSMSVDSFDYLFSITHLEIIDDTVLQLPNKLSINFHDGLLPKYAGLNCPAWALLNEEERYGISWHQITTGVDEGAILVQEQFDIAPDETSLSLNTKCFAAALKSFPALLDMLVGEDISTVEQDLSKRNYYGKYQRPEFAGIIDWSKPAMQIETQIRALDFGNYTNPLGCAKILVEDCAYVVDGAIAQVEEGSSGKIIGLEEGELSVATGEGSIVLNSIKSLDGADVSITEFVKKHGITIGQVLPLFNANIIESLTVFNEQICRSEVYWTQRLSELEPVELPVSFGSSAANEAAGYESVTLSLDVSADSIDAVICAYLLVLARYSNKEVFDVALSFAQLRADIGGFEAVVAANPIFRATFDFSSDISSALAAVVRERENVQKRSTWSRDLISRQPELHHKPELLLDCVVPVCIATETSSHPFIPPLGSTVTLVISEDSVTARLVYERTTLSKHVIQRLQTQLQTYYQAIVENPLQKIGEISLLSEVETFKVEKEWNQTEATYADESCIHHLFEQQVLDTPDNIALVFEGEEMTYLELNQEANRLAHTLVKNGVGPGVLVGIYVERSFDLMVGTLGILKAGGAYVPLDPVFPIDRIKFMIDDAEMTVIVTQQRLVQQLPSCGALTLIMDDDAQKTLSPVDKGPDCAVHASDLCYVIYTSGSTGQPKGVMVEHRNVLNFFAGMDAKIDHENVGAWMAVTSLSFDISVLELFWTLTRGFKVVIYLDRDKAGEPDHVIPHSIKRRPMAFGLFMWGNDDAPGREKYRLMLEGAKYFDENGFDSVWTPERHFHAFGGPYPNPAVTGAAIAATTSNLSIRAGSCVSPLHHPIRIAEDWAVIDNLSNGRVGLSFASGWQPNDFVIKPENHQSNKAIMLDQIEVVRKLWRGEKVAFENPMKDMVEILTLPRPVQKELPVWVTTAGNPETYKQAGALGANVLTHLLGQTVDELAEKIRLYRAARKEAGFDPQSGLVTLMLHTFVGDSNEQIKEIVREPMKDYLRSAMKLAMDFAWSFPAFKRPRGEDSKVEDIDIKSLTEDEKETILDFAFERYFENSGLFGHPDKCVEMVNKCKQADIDEIACLLDFGVDTESIMASLPSLKKVKDATNEFWSDSAGLTFSEQVEQHGVTHMQCTPSMARMLSLNSDSRNSLSKIDHLIIGGEALPDSLAKDLVSLGNKSLTNMYGPTETTIWSTTQKIDVSTDGVPIGRPIANTKIYILDRFGKPTPPGVPGELFIGGAGVVRGYLNQPGLTAERFVADRFSQHDGDRIYWTGDLACYREDGVIEFHGRIDHQVKIRGYRIELGEIEASIEKIDGVQESVVVLREDTPGDQRLVAYVVTDNVSVKSSDVKETLRRVLPDYMVPGDVALLDALPLTPNGKVDRNSLPSPHELAPSREEIYAAPEGELEEKIVELWQNTLKVEKVGTSDNFFDLGGHSLLIVRLHAQFEKAVGQQVSLTDLYRFPTIRSLVNYFNSSGSTEILKKSTSRAQRRREITRKRRKRA